MNILSLKSGNIHRAIVGELIQQQNKVAKAADHKRLLWVNQRAFNLMFFRGYDKSQYKSVFFICYSRKSFRQG